MSAGPLLSLDDARAHPRLEASLRHRARRLAHLLRAAAAVLQRARDHVAGKLAPVADREEILERGEHNVLDTVAARSEQRLGEQGFHALDDDAAAHFGRRRLAEGVRVDGTAGETERLRDGQKLARVSAAE